MALFQLEKRNQIVTVDMNEAKCWKFTSKVNATGTRNLKGCHVAIIASPHAAVLAHIAPGPSKQKGHDSKAMMKHVSDQLDNVEKLYKANKTLFPSTDHQTHTVHAWFNDEIGLPDQQRLIHERLIKLGLPRPSSHRYDMVPKANYNPDDKKGTVVVLGASPLRVLVEDNVVAPPGQQLKSTALNQSAGPSSVKLPEGVPPKFTGCVYTNAAYVYYKDGVEMERMKDMPPGGWIYNPNGWGGSSKNWAYWDGNPKHQIQYK